MESKKFEMNRAEMQSGRSERKGLLCMAAGRVWPVLGILSKLGGRSIVWVVQSMPPILSHINDNIMFWVEISGPKDHHSLSSYAPSCHERTVKIMNISLSLEIELTLATTGHSS